MNKFTRRLLYLIALSAMLMLFALPVQAASCTCAESTMPHNSSHNIEYLSDGASGHKIFCYTCYYSNGHNFSCALVSRGTEAHTLTISGTGADRKETCGKCGYSALAPCPHTIAKWTVIYPMTGPKSSATTCVKYCDDCKSVAETKAHNTGYKSVDGKSHKVFCKDCSYTITTYADHRYTYTYAKLPVPGDPTTTTIVNSMAVSPSTYHTAQGRCTQCGQTQTLYQEHTFSGNACSKCGLKKQILSKVTRPKGKQIGRGKHTTQTITAKWLWDGIRWIWRSAGKAHTYSYNVKLSWKKQKNASGYVISVDKNRIKTGTPAANAWSFYFTRKTSIKYPLAVARKMKKATFYIAPVDQYGFIGKQCKVTVKLK